MLDISGQIFGRLTALEPTPARYARSVVWMCRCECGKIVRVSVVRLNSGNCQSCGCLAKEVSAKNFRRTSMRLSSIPVDGGSPDFPIGWDELPEQFDWEHHIKVNGMVVVDRL